MDIVQIVKNVGGKLWRKATLLCRQATWPLLVRCTRVVPNQVMFRTYQDKYTCNPKYLCEQLIRSGKDYSLVWAVSQKTGNRSQFPPQVKLVEVGSSEFHRAMAASKVWVDNAHNFTWQGFPKKKEQLFINLWHGSLGLKRIDPANDSNPHRRKAGALAGKTTTYCISNSDFEEMVFRTSYWPNTPFLRYGHCRNDLMFVDEAKLLPLRKKVCQALGINESKKIFLYAPTFRDGDDFTCFDVDYAGLYKALQERFGGDWVIVTRMHYHTQLIIQKNAERLQRPSYDFVVSGDIYDDMQELLAVTDAGLTDYSSWICDFVLTGRPAFLFVTDRESYVTERGFYYPLEETPFPIAENNEQLLANVRGFDAEAYAAKTKVYLDGLGCTEDGRACERLAALIDREIEKGKW